MAKKQKIRKKLRKVIDETFKISNRKKNGIIKLSVEVDEKDRLNRYSLTYVNANFFAKDNGRVLGYDNCHGHHHRHFKGAVEPVDFVSMEKISELFEIEWRKIHEEITN